MSVGGEIADLLIFLMIVCVPLAVGAVCIPVGRALADRVRGSRRDVATEDMLLRTLWEIEGRLAELERTVAAQAVGPLTQHQQRPVNRAASPQAALGPSAAPQAITPH